MCIYLTFNGICTQDCLATIPPYPNYICNRVSDYDVASSISDPKSMWIVRQQLFYKCSLRPFNATMGCYNIYLEDIPQVESQPSLFSAYDDLQVRLLSSGQIELGRCTNPLMFLG